MIGGCSPRGAIQLDPSAARTGSVQNILVASTRTPVDGSAVLSGQRARTVEYLDFAVAAPPERLKGTVTFPRSTPPDPATDFVTTSANRLSDRAAFTAAVNARAARLPRDKREALVFVHGFNTTFAEGLYRQAQISHDFQSQGVSVNYAWPSAGDVRAYAFDRESALFARDGLESSLTALADSTLSSIVVLGHSMGAQVVMDTLRQMAIRGAPSFFHKLSSVVLIAPDLDIDVFRTQVNAMRAYDVPIYIFVSSRDRALRLSSLLRGRSQPRLGSISDSAPLGDLVDGGTIRVIDMTDFDANGDPLQHFKAASSPSMIALFSGMGTAGLQMFREGENRPTLLESGILATQEVTGAVLGIPSSR
jgi:esterase/lipase superfamily enzyme